MASYFIIAKNEALEEPMKKVCKKQSTVVK